VAQARRDARGRLGVAGEAAVAAWYERAGYDVLDRNWRCREGELDLVLRSGRLVVFCEVKTRRGDAFGAPFEAVTVTKQRRIRILAARWLSEHPLGGVDVRFDVASVVADGNRSPTIDVIESAF
jgi:putative endonuclease